MKYVATKGRLAGVKLTVGGTGVFDIMPETGPMSSVALSDLDEDTIREIAGTQLGREVELSLVVKAPRKSKQKAKPVTEPEVFRDKPLSAAPPKAKAPRKARASKPAPPPETEPEPEDEDETTTPVDKFLLDDLGLTDVVVEQLTDAEILTVEDLIKLTRAEVIELADLDSLEVDHIELMLRAFNWALSKGEITNISQLEIGTRTTNALTAAGLTDVAKIAVFNKRDLNKIDGLGRGSVAELCNAMAEAGHPIAGH